MTPDRLFVLLSVWTDTVIRDEGNSETFFWLCRHGFIDIAPTLTGFKVTKRGRLVIEAALDKANQYGCE